MSYPLIEPRLLDFLLFDWLRADGSDSDTRATLQAVLDAATRLATDAFLPLYRAADVDEPQMREGEAVVLPALHGALEQFRELGMFGASFDEANGGLGLPYSTWLALHAIYASANVSAFGYAMLTIANARLLTAFGSQAQIEMFALPQVEGRWFGTMCLSEPQAGSSLGDVKTRARPDGEDGLGARYRLFGNKMWISGGDQDISANIVHLVLAKLESEDGQIPAGSKGLSLFIVPKRLPDGKRNDVALAGLNHKMGFRGMTNCLLNFGESEGAVGWRVGAVGQGLAQMFMMMNEARLGVGMCAAAIAYRGYRHAARYARERLQGRLPGSSAGAPVAIIEHADVRRMLLQQKAYAEGAVALCLYCARLVEAGDPDAEALLALLTPVAKSWPSEFGLIANDLAIQVHGGYGYTRDFDVEQLWRDNRLNPIHEGTAGIQAQDLLRRKLLGSDGTALALLRARIDATIARARPASSLADHVDDLSAYWDEIDAAIATLKAADPAAALREATMFLRAFGHGVIGWIWLDLALAASTLPEVERDGMHCACRFFFDDEMPQGRSWLGIAVRQSPAATTIPTAALGD